MAGYNRTRYVEQLLEKTESLPPSFTVHLHPEYWVLNNGSKFLYHNQIASLLDDIRAQRIPVDFMELFDSARVPFYDGCMVVELLDYRPQRSKEPALKVPEKTRVVLHPNSETLWADICLMNRRNGAQWTDKDALEVEAKILLATSQPLCLDPDPHLTRIVNSVLRMSTPIMPPSLKRKAAAMEPEEDGPEKARRSRILSFMAPQNNKSHMPSYRILDALSTFRLKGEEAGTGQADQASMAGHQYMNGVPLPPQSAPPHSQPTISMPTTAPVPVQGASPIDVDKTPQKADVTPLVAFNVSLPRTNGSNTPLPLQSTHQFVNQHPPSIHPIPNGMLPQVYPSVQAATEAANKPATPAPHVQMQHYMQQHYQQQQQQSHPQNQSRPPSQPQHPQQPAHQQPQQHFTQSPKLPQSNATSPALTQPTSQPFPVQPTFQPPIPHHFQQQQPPPGGRNGPGTQPTNQQALYAQSFQQQLHNQNPNSILLHQQRIRNAAGGRATPQTQVQGFAQQHPATPSPVKNSPNVTHQQLAAAQARSSPMPVKAQLPQQQHQLSAQQMQMSPHLNRVAFAPQYNSSQLRPLVHGNPPSGHMVAPNQGVVTSSPSVLGQTMTSEPQASGRPITPALAMASGDGNQQQSGQVQGQMQGLLQQPLRRQTPQQPLQGLAIARAASQSRSPHTPQAQVKQQTPQLANRTPQLRQRTPQQQFQQIQNQQSSPQAQAQAQTQSQPQSQPQMQPQTQAQQQPGHPHYAQMYSYPQFTLNTQMPGTFWQQRSMQGMTPQQLLLMQQVQQQQQQVQQPQQQQPQPQAQQQQVSVVAPQQPQGSIPIMTNSQQTPGYKMGGRGKVGQKKRGGGAGR